MKRVLRQCGYRVGHELIRRDGVCSWEMAVDTKKVLWGDARNGYRFDHIFHQVRHPLKAIASVYFTEPLESFAFFQSHIPEIKAEDSRLTQSAKYWYYWNLKAEAQAEWTYRIEELHCVWEEFETRLGRKLDKSALEIVPKTVNTRGNLDHLTWEELEEALEPDLYQKIRALAQKYGY